MRADRVVVLAPSFDDDLRLHQVVEQFDVQAFIAQFSIEGFVVSVLPRAAGFNVERLRADAAEPIFGFATTASASRVYSSITVNMR